MRLRALEEIRQIKSKSVYLLIVFWCEIYSV
jgi:hypothetical protein